MTDIKTPPHSEQDESFVLGCMMIEKEACERALEILAPADFYLPANGDIFGVSRDLYMAGNPVDVSSVCSELRRTNKLVEAGGAEKIVGMVVGVSTSAHVGHHAQMVKSYSILRQLIARCTEIVGDCYRHEDEPGDILEKAEKFIYSISESGLRSELVLMKDTIHEHIELLESIHKKEAKTTGLETGFVELDRITSGFQPGNMIVLAARPGVGKTSLALDIVRNAVLRDVPVAFFSLEMTQGEIIQRMLSALTGISLFQIRTGFFGAGKWVDLHHAAEKLYNAPFYMDCSSLNMSAVNIRSSCRRLAGKLAREGKKLGMIVVDYLQLISSNARRYENRQAEVADISRSLKAVAMDLQVPVLAISQLNRQTEEAGRAGRPRLSDLRESGSIEQDADLVAFIYREALYKSGATDEEKSKSKLIIAKHRNGALAEIDMFFVKENTRFVEMERERV